MELKQWLNRGYDVSKKLAIKTAHMESLGNTISNYEPREIDRDNPENSAETTLIRWSELKAEVDELTYKLMRIDRQVDRELKRLKSSSEYAVLYCRYIRRLSWEDIPKATNYSKARVFSLHRDGIEDLDKITCYQDWEDES